MPDEVIITDEVCGIFEIKKEDILKSMGLETGAFIIAPMLLDEVLKRGLNQSSVYFMVKQVEMPKETGDEPIQAVAP